MVALQCLGHAWKQSLRSTARGQQTAGGIILLVLALLFAINLLGLGLFLHELLKELEPDSDPILLFSGWVPYLLGIDLVLRLFLQRIPGQVLVPYLTLRVPRSVLVHLLMARSFVSLSNVLPWVVIVPFAIKGAIPVYGPAGAAAWVAALALLVVANSLMNLVVRKTALTALPAALGIGAAVAALYVLDQWSVISLGTISSTLFAAVLEHPALASLALCAPALLYATAFRVLRRRMSLEDLVPASTVRADSSAPYRLLESRGSRGRFATLELKLFLRNRRPRAGLLMGLTVIPMGVLFYGMLVEDEQSAYAVPTAEALALARQSEPGPAPPGLHRVRFRLDAGALPAGAHPHVTGDHPSLASWDPDAVPLLLDADSGWSRSFMFESGTELRYCFTLGSWSTEEQDVEGSDSPVRSLTIASDTVITRGSVGWKTPSIPLMVELNLVYWGLIMTGILMFVYGQFFLSIESTFFDALLSWRIRFRWMLATKVSILLWTGVLTFVLSLPYGLMDGRILAINTACFLYNVGVNSFVMVYLAARSRKRYELQESLFSQQGKSAAQFVAILPMWILPIVVVGVLDAVGVPDATVLFLGGAGALGLALQKPIRARLLAVLVNSRHEIAAGFRQTGVS